MKLFPTHQQTIHTFLSPAEVTKRLSEHTLPKMPFNTLSCKRNTFWGTVNSHDFTISLLGEGSGHSFAPRIHGIIDGNENGTELHLSMALYAPVLFFMKFYISACIFFFLIALVISLLEGHILWAFFLVPTLIAVCAMSMTHISFQMGHKNAVSSLTHILK